MAEALVSALVTTITGNLNSSFLREVGLAGDLETELQNLKRTFLTIQAVLQDAEGKQWKNEAIKLWLINLKDVAYDAEDLLEDFAVAAKRNQERRDLINQVRSFFSRHHNPLFFRVKMAHKLKNVRERLDAIAKDRENFHLREGAVETEADSFKQRQTWSHVNESETYGRGQEKEDLINMLLTNSADFCVYAICGMGGLGKTTLSQLVYNDGRVKMHFDLEIWVCVSVDFNITRLTRAIIESIDGTSPNLQELDTLGRRLQEKMSGKRYLLVLDDVWDDDHDNWSRLKDVLRCGAIGSSVIITTRLATVADKMATTPVHYMQTLSDDDSWLLFKQLAFRRRNREEYANLEEIGRLIVMKCGGVPLALRALGILMRSKKREAEWLSVKESEIWDLPNEGSQIFPALSLSYMNLKPHVKQCFAFCSIFPKDYVMVKEQLVSLWMANGFIPRDVHTDLHDKGHEIFNALLERSFLQEVKDDWFGSITYKMHDLIHDLAQFIMKHESYSIEDSTKMEKLETIRHIALSGRSHCTLHYKDLRDLRLRSLIFHDINSFSDAHSLHFLFCTQKHLKALHLQQKHRKLPMSICNLKHLKYLDVSDSSIEALPESITTLQNLQTLNLQDCRRLRHLPKGMKNMKNLMYLDIFGCDSLRCMPARMGELSDLRKLSMFLVGKEEGHHIGELGRLNYLGGELIFKNLGNVKSINEAKNANLIEKMNLESLKFRWEKKGEGNEKFEEVLSGLQPHKNLERLNVFGYGGPKFPYWLMNLNLLLPNLTDVWLKGCDNCEQLPPFGKLQFLKHLYLRGMDGVKCIGSDVYGEDDHPFPSLETLDLSMKNLEQWETLTGRESFPRLHRLRVMDCPMLVEIPIIPLLKTLEINGGEGGVTDTLLRSVRNLTSLTSLHIANTPNLISLSIDLLQNHTQLSSLTLFKLRNLKTLSNQILDNLFALKRLSVWECDELESLPEEGLCNLNSLVKLEIFSCHRLNSLPVNGLSGLTSLRYLHVYDCNGLSSLSNQIGYLISLSSLTIQCCPNLMSLPDGIQSLSMLRELHIMGCPCLEKRCKKGSGEDWPKIAHIPNITISGEVIQGVWT